MIHAKNGEPERDGRAKHKAKKKRPKNVEREVDYQPIGQDQTNHQEIEEFNRRINK